MKPTPDNNPFAIPPPLLAEIQAEADEEHRPAADVLHDAVKQYVRQKRLQRSLSYGPELAAALTKGDGPRPIPETRKEKQQGRDRVAFRTEELSEAEIEAITEGGMDERHNHLNAELD